MTRGRAHMGMAGWVYPDLRGGFYPKGLTQKNELAYSIRPSGLLDRPSLPKRPRPPTCARAPR